jgi:hypothetical protein
MEEMVVVEEAKRSLIDHRLTKLPVLFTDFSPL